MFRRVAALFLVASALFCRAVEPCDAIATFADAKKPLREIFVSPSGNNFKGNGSREDPFQTINRALQGIRPGDAVRLLPGAYTSGAYVANVSGTADAPISLGGEPGPARPVFSGESAGIHISRAQYFVLENLEVTGAKGNGINCDDGGDFANSNASCHIVFRNLSIHDTGSGGNQDGLKLSGVNNYFVLDCEFARISAGGSGIDHVGCHNGIIARCKFTDGGNAIQCKGGSANIEIRQSRFVNPADRGINIGGSTGLTLFRPPLSTNAPNVEARDIRVIANLFVGGSVSPVAFVGTTNSLVANNTIIDPKRWIVRILQETTSTQGYNFAPCGQNRFLNNLIYFNGAQISIAVNVGANTDPQTCEFANNLWFDHNAPDRSRPTLPLPETNGLYGLDPHFTDVAAGDYSLAAGSPALGKGKKLSNVRADLQGRCYDDAVTMGAFAR